MHIEASTGASEWEWERGWAPTFDWGDYFYRPGNKSKQPQGQHPLDF